MYIVITHHLHQPCALDIHIVGVTILPLSGVAETHEMNSYGACQRRNRDGQKCQQNPKLSHYSSCVAVTPANRTRQLAIPQEFNTSKVTQTQLHQLYGADPIACHQS